MNIDLLLALSQEAFDLYYDKLGRGSTLIVDSAHVKKVARGDAIQVPISEWAREATGMAITANVLSLGLIAGLTGAVSAEALEKAVRARAPRGTAEINLRAMQAGLDHARELRQSDR